jgi:anthranilate synthase component 1
VPQAEAATPASRPVTTAARSATRRRLELGADDLLDLHSRFPDRFPVLLESIGGEPRLGRFDVLLAAPGGRLTLTGDRRLLGSGREPGLDRALHEVPDGFLAALDRWWLSDREPVDGGDDSSPDLPFGGGWFLYLGYELASEIEPSLDLPSSGRPIAMAWRMRGAVIYDRRQQQGWCVAEPGNGELHDELRGALDVLHGSASLSGAPPAAIVDGAVDEESPDRFLDGVESILAAIGRGDVYQANLSRRWRARLAADSGEVDLYRRLRRANPAPFAGIARLGEFSVLSSSPERLIRVVNGIASTRPIAGTRPRGSDVASDARLRSELVLNEKERAEHIMLVDLERNDLGRVCRAGTVSVDEFMTIESYAHVHHIVSNVRGELRPDVTPGRAVAAVFPGGTITGCPKVRCMQLLAELEREPREAYTGSMGYLGLDGSLDLNILIRTLTVDGDAIEFRTGAGIVADSSPAAELEETRAKARGLLRALGSAA